MEKDILTIQKLSLKTGETQNIARIPFQSGTYPTGHGDLKMSVFKPRKDFHQKVVFYGSVIPTLQERGKRRQFQQTKENPRRVVNLPARADRKVMQPLAEDEYLVFKRKKK